MPASAERYSLKTLLHNMTSVLSRWFVIIICLAGLVIGLVLLYPDGDVYTINESEKHWYQPWQLNALYPNPISPTLWHFGFESVEKKLLTLVFDGTFVVNEQTPAVFNDAVLLLPKKLSETDIERLVWLTEKTFTGEEGQQLGQLLVDFYLYRVEVQEKKKGRSTNRQIGLEEFALQQAYFGKKNAKLMFARQHALASFLYERRRIQADVQISVKEKNEQLEALTQQFQQSQKERLSQ